MNSCAARSSACLIALTMGLPALSYLETRQAPNGAAQRAKEWQLLILRYNHAPWG